MFATKILFARRRFRIKIDYENPKPYYESFEDLFKTKKQLKIEKLIRKQHREKALRERILKQVVISLAKLRVRIQKKEEKEKLKKKLIEDKKLLKEEKEKVLFFYI